MGARPTTRRKSQQSGRTPKVGRVLAAVTVEEVEESVAETPVWDESEDSLLEAWEDGLQLREGPQLFAMAGYTYSQQLAEQEYQKKEVKPVEQVVPPEYHQYLQVLLQGSIRKTARPRPI